MRLCVIFLILNIHLSHIFATSPNPLELPLQPNHRPQGYECGNFFFTYKEVKEALSIALDSFDKGFRYPEIYLGKLYGESDFEEYFLYPIKNGPQILPNIKQTGTVFFIVLTRNSIEEVDVVAKLITFDYTKCIRRYRKYVGLSHSVPENPNGYLCGHEFFTDITIRESHDLAQKRFRGNPKYPSPYVGSLYPENSGHLIWPIMKGKFLYQSGTDRIGPYFLILNNQLQFVDVVVRGYRKNFLRCIRSRKPPKAPASDPFNKLFVPPPKSGFICGKIFLHDTVLEKSAETVKKKVNNAIKGMYPTEYLGPPFDQQCLIWPILEDGGLFKTGSRGPYRLVLTTEYKVMSVAMIVNGRLKACDRKTMMAIKNHDTSDYHCNNRRFSHQQLVAVAEEACAKMKILTRNFYPARYEGPRFVLDGPYFTYPVSGNGVGNFRFNAGLHRVVINMNCEVVGALATLRIRMNGEPNNRVLKKLVRCHRLADGPLPPGFFGDNAEAVFEHRVRH